MKKIDRSLEIGAPAGNIRMRSIILAPFNATNGSHNFTINHDEIFKVDEAEAKRLEKEHKAMRLY